MKQYKIIEANDAADLETQVNAIIQGSDSAQWELHSIMPHSGPGNKGVAVLVREI